MVVVAGVVARLTTAILLALEGLAAQAAYWLSHTIEGF
jgi:hypothetical protein